MKNFKVKSSMIGCETKIIETVHKLRGNIDLLDNKKEDLWQGKNASSEISNLKKIIEKSTSLLEEFDKLDI